jgi:outer membrane murein-binding lipoprotein Lpp
MVSAAMAGAATLGGCSSSPPPDLASPVPSARIEAIGDASKHPSPQELKGLIAQLDSDDPAVRVFAIAALEHATGQRRGYDPADPPRLREEAADRWQKWYCQEYGLPAPDDRWKEGEARPAGGQTGSGEPAGRTAPDPHQ